MVDDFEKVALDCLSNSHLRRAALVVIDEVPNYPFCSASVLVHFV